jgi:hypothetical protein
LSIPSSGSTAKVLAIGETKITQYGQDETEVKLPVVPGDQPGHYDPSLTTEMPYTRDTVVHRNGWWVFAEILKPER